MMMRRFGLPSLYVLSLSLFLSLAGCGGGSIAAGSSNSGSGNGSGSSGGSGGSGSSSTPFTVTSITPASGTANVTLNSPIQINLSSQATISTVNPANIQVMAGSTAVAGAVTYNDSNHSATFTPSALLAANTSYKVTVNGVTSSTGTTVTPFSSSFTTGTTQSTATNSYAVEYQASLFPSAAGFNGVGQIFIETCGCVTVELSGAAPTTSYTVLFCPAYPGGGSTPSTPACFSAGTVETDAKGDMDQDVAFPKPGAWAGDFELEAGTTVQYSTNLVAPTAAGGSTQLYLATLEPLTTVNGGALKPAGTSVTQSPITAGTATWFNGALLFSLTGGSASTTYTASESGDAVGGTGSNLLNNSMSQSAFTSDSSGNLNFAVLQDGAQGDLLELQPGNNQAGFIGGFTVPN